MYQSVEQFTDMPYIIALLSCCISTLGDINLFGSVAKIKTVTKYLKGNQKFDPQNGLNTRTAKVSKGGHTSLTRTPAYSPALQEGLSQTPCDTGVAAGAAPGKGTAGAMVIQRVN